jgi:hypothetical protein
MIYCVLSLILVYCKYCEFLFGWHNALNTQHQSHDFVAWCYNDLFQCKWISDDIFENLVKQVLIRTWRVPAAVSRQKVFPSEHITIYAATLKDKWCFSSWMSRSLRFQNLCERADQPVGKEEVCNMFSHDVPCLFLMLHDMMSGKHITNYGHLFCHEFF